MPAPPSFLAAPGQESAFSSRCQSILTLYRSVVTLRPSLNPLIFLDGLDILDDFFQVRG